jgi:hypothetical protein
MLRAEIQLIPGLSMPDSIESSPGSQGIAVYLVWLAAIS